MHNKSQFEHIESTENVENAVVLKQWRRDCGIDRDHAAEKLGISKTLYTEYETGKTSIPKYIMLAQRALVAGLEYQPSANVLNRERWVQLVDNLTNYGKGQPIFGQLLNNHEWQQIADFLHFVHRGPLPALAFTDPSLFKTLRASVTAAQLAGLGHFYVEQKDVPDLIEKSKLLKQRQLERKKAECEQVAYKGCS